MPSDDRTEHCNAYPPKPTLNLSSLPTAWQRMATVVAAGGFGDPRTARGGAVAPLSQLGSGNAPRAAERARPETLEEQYIIDQASADDAANGGGLRKLTKPIEFSLSFWRAVSHEQHKGAGTRSAKPGIPDCSNGTFVPSCCRLTT